MARDKIRVQGVLMTRDAACRVEETGTDVQTDVDAVRRGKITREDLMAECLEGFEATEHATESSWMDYVDAVMEAAKGPELRLLEVLRKAEEVCRLYLYDESSTEAHAAAIIALKAACAEAQKDRV